MSTLLHTLPLRYTETPSARYPANVYLLAADVDGNLTLPANTNVANVEIAVSDAYTLTNPTTLVDGERYVVRIEVTAAPAVGSTLAFGTNWVKLDGTGTFDASANGDINLIVGYCMTGKIYYQLFKKSAD